MQTSIRTALPAALSAALVAGALAVPALATTDEQAPDEPAATATEEDRESPARRGHLLGRGDLRGLDEGELADRLGAELDIDPATVQDALDVVRQDLAADRLADAVESGRLTQAQADEISAALADGTLEDVLPAIRLEQLEDRLADRVESGELTQEEADEILTDAAEGDRRGPGRRHHGGDRRGPGAVAPEGAA